MQECNRKTCLNRLYLFTQMAKLKQSDTHTPAVSSYVLKYHYCKYSSVQLRVIFILLVLWNLNKKKQKKNPVASLNYSLRQTRRHWSLRPSMKSPSVNSATFIDSKEDSLTQCSLLCTPTSDESSTALCCFHPSAVKQASGNKSAPVAYLKISDDNKLV